METSPELPRRQLSRSGALRRVLFVDDEPAVRNAFAREVGSRGFLVDLAASASEALAHFRQIRHPVVVTDLSMPGLSGVSLIREIVQEDPHALFVVVTGIGSPQLPVDDELGSRIVSVVSKPWDVDELVSTLHRSARLWQLRSMNHERSNPDGNRRVLLIEDDDSDAEIVEMALDVGTWQITRSIDLKTALEHIESDAYDVVLTDLTLPDARGIDAVLRLRSFTAETPIVVLSGLKDDTIALETVQAGAQDFLVKGHFDRPTLSRSLRHATERKTREANLRKLANEDALTGLGNRSRFQERLDETFARARRTGDTFGIMYLDLDGFKAVNDQLGHDAGDNLLVEVARRIETSVRETDFAARLGGDEFAIIMESVRSYNGATTLASRLLSTIARPYGSHPVESAVTASIGIALVEPEHTSESLIKAADVAMYAAKRSGRNRYELAVSPSWRPETRRTSSIETAVAHGELRLHYQVLVDRAGRHCAAEALLRWQRGERLLLPAEFLPELEASDALSDVEDWVLRTACQQAAHWQSSGAPIARVSVNLSASQLRSRLVGAVKEALGLARLAPSALVLELDEAAATSEPGTEVLRQLKKLGVRIALDRFGTGACSLSTLFQLPIDILKFDRSFAVKLLDGPLQGPSLRAVVKFAHELGLETVAAGIETAEQRDKLLTEGCDLLQGYYFGAPVPATSAAGRYSGVNT